MIELSAKWLNELASQPETGMGYQIVSVTLENGNTYDQVAVVDGRIAKIRGRKDIPFDETQVARIVVTHAKWDFNSER